MARVKKTFFGLPVNDRETISFKKIDPELSRELFIREALVNNRLRSRQRMKFVSHNQKICEQLAEFEERVRTRDIQIDDEYLYKFYAEQLPESVFDRTSLEKWYKQQEKNNPETLCLDEALLSQRVDQDQLAQFPSVLEWDGLRFDLSYEFKPNSDANLFGKKISFHPARTLFQRSLLGDQTCKSLRHGEGGSVAGFS